MFKWSIKQAVVCTLVSLSSVSLLSQASDESTTTLQESKQLTVNLENLSKYHWKCDGDYGFMKISSLDSYSSSGANISLGQVKFYEDEEKLGDATLLIVSKTKVVQNGEYAELAVVDSKTQVLEANGISKSFIDSVFKDTEEQSASKVESFTSDELILSFEMTDQDIEIKAKASCKAF